MKKVISIALLLALCLTLFAGCAEEPAAATDLDNAIDYLYNMYKSDVKGEDIKMTKDTEFLAVVSIDGNTYNVEWTVEVTAGAKENVSITDGKTATTKCVKLAEVRDAETKFTLTATVTDGKDSKSVSFNFVAPEAKKVEVSNDKEVVLYFPTDNKYVTSAVYAYTGSSGSTKDELVLSDKKSDAMILVIKSKADGKISFATKDGKYLFCDGTNVNLADEESEFTLFTLENAEGGQYIKSNAFYNDNPEKPQYLEVYSGYLTCYGMNAEKANIYTFTLEDAEGAGTTQPEDPNKPEEDEPGEDEPGTSTKPTTPAEIVAAAFALAEGETLDGTYKLTGVVTEVGEYNEQYGDVNLTFTVEGKDIYCYALKGDVQNIKVGDTITVNGTIKNYKGTVEFERPQLVTEGSEGGEGNTPVEPSADYITSAPVAGTAYKLGLFQEKKNTSLYFDGNIYKTYAWYMNTVEDKAAAIEVYVEEVTGGYRLYFTKDGVKTYLDAHIDGTHYSLRLTTEPTAVWTWDAELNTLVVDLDGTVCFIGTSGTYTSLSCNKMEKVEDSFIAHLFA